jgi:outer membrane immunogenic protein
MYSPIPVANWTGFYAGVHVGAGWGSNDASANLAVIGPVSLTAGTVNGFLGGGQIGYNWQTGWMVLGGEFEFSGAGVEGTSPCIVLINCKANMDWLITAAGRLGFTVDRALVYAKGGVAWADWQYNANIAGINANAGDTRFGWLLGLGVEYAIAPNWSAKIEYNYIDFGNDDFRFAVGAAGITANIDTQLHTIKGGVNYRFW